LRSFQVRLTNNIGNAFGQAGVGAEAKNNDSLDQGIETCVAEKVHEKTTDRADNGEKWQGQDDGRGTLKEYKAIIQETKLV